MKPVNLLPKLFTNRSYDNAGLKMADNDGPAYVVYGKRGIGKCSMEIDLSALNIQNVRRSDNRTVNAYMFLGADIYEGDRWINCFDTGFCYSGNPGRWHLFYNIFDPSESAQGWFESNVTLESSHDFRIELDMLRVNGYAVISLYDITEKLYADIALFRVKGLDNTGENTSPLMNFALDYPPDVKRGRDGKPSEDWAEITLYNTDEGLKLTNINVRNARVYKDGKGCAWTPKYTDHRGVWPDISYGMFDYDCTKITFGHKITDTDYTVDLDMNR